MDPKPCSKVVYADTMQQLEAARAKTNRMTAVQAETDRMQAGGQWSSYLSGKD